MTIPQGVEWEFYEGPAGTQVGTMAKQAIRELDETMADRRNQEDIGRASGFFHGGSDQVVIPKEILEDSRFKPEKTKFNGEPR